MLEPFKVYAACTGYGGREYTVEAIFSEKEDAHSFLVREGFSPSRCWVQSFEVHGMYWSTIEKD